MQPRPPANQQQRPPQNGQNGGPNGGLVPVLIPVPSGQGHNPVRQSNAVRTNIYDFSRGEYTIEDIVCHKLYFVQTLQQMHYFADSGSSVGASQTPGRVFPLSVIDFDNLGCCY